MITSDWSQSFLCTKCCLNRHQAENMYAFEDILRSKNERGINLKVGGLSIKTTWFLNISAGWHNHVIKTAGLILMLKSAFIVRYFAISASSKLPNCSSDIMILVIFQNVSLDVSSDWIQVVYPQHKSLCIKCFSFNCGTAKNLYS